jgi:hypothetical protein
VGSKSVTEIVTEWASPTVRDLGGKLFFLFVIGLFAALYSAKRRVAVTDLVTLGAFLWLGLSAGRNIVWFMMVAFPPLAAALASRRERVLGRDPGHPVANGVLIAILGLFVVLTLPWVRPHLGLPPTMTDLLGRDTPVAAVERLRALPPARRPKRLYHTDGFGSYLIWAAPEQPVYVDTRFELYPFKMLDETRHLNRGCNVDETLARQRIDGLLLDRKRQKELLARVRASGRWQLVYQDRVAALLLPAGR